MLQKMRERGEAQGAQPRPASINLFIDTAH